MTFPTRRPCLWLLILHLLCSNSVTSLYIDHNLASTAPKTFWLDQTCISKGFTPVTAQESLDIAGFGSKRLLNLHDSYQAWVFNLLFKSERDFSLLDRTAAEAWEVVETEGWISKMKYDVNSDTADVRIYCDNDARWTLVPDDPISIARGMPANSQRTPGDDQEFEDPVNFMRRSTANTGCGKSLALGVRYNSMYPPNTGGVPANYHSPRQTITICDLAFRSPIKQFAQIPFREWRFLTMNYLSLIPTNVLLYQLLQLAPYYIGGNTIGTMTTQDSWARMLVMDQEQLESHAMPYSWNAILAYAASLGWGLQQGLTHDQYWAGQGLFRYSSALINVPFIRGGPQTPPTWLVIPAIISGVGTS